MPSTSKWETPLQPLGCSGQHPIQKSPITLNAAPLPVAADQMPVFQTLNFLTPPFTTFQPGNPNPPPDGDNQVQEIQQHLSHLQMHSANEALFTSRRSAFVDLRRQQTPSSSRRLLLHPSPNLSSCIYGRWLPSVSPEQDQPIDLSVKKKEQ